MMQLQLNSASPAASPPQGHALGGAGVGGAGGGAGGASGGPSEGGTASHHAEETQDKGTGGGTGSGETADKKVTPTFRSSSWAESPLSSSNDLMGNSLASYFSQMFDQQPSEGLSNDKRFGINFGSRSVSRFHAENYYSLVKRRILIE